MEKKAAGNAACFGEPDMNNGSNTGRGNSVIQEPNKGRNSVPDARGRRGS